MGGWTRTKVRQPPSSAKHHYSEQHQPVRTSSPQVHHADPVPCAGTWGWRGGPALWRGNGTLWPGGIWDGTPNSGRVRVRLPFVPKTTGDITPLALDLG